MDSNYAYTSTSIAAPGLSTLLDQKSKASFGPSRDINSVADIEGASCKVAYGDKFKNKPTFMCNADIEKSRPAPLRKERNVRDLSLVVDDIEGTRHTVTDQMMRTSRHVNPLNPDYQLPSCNPMVVPEPKFLRDAHDVSDIEGAKAKPKREVKSRDIMSNEGVIGAQAGWKPRHRRCRVEASPHPVMVDSGPELKDKKFAERSTRVTDPVDPVYIYNGVELKNEQGSKPKPLKKYIHDNKGQRTDDIDGAQRGARNINRRDYRNIMTTLDVEGAQADTVFHTIQTARVVNPLEPVYTDLDGRASAPLVKPLLPSAMAGIPTIKAKKSIPSLVSIDPNQGTHKSKVYNASSFADKASQENMPLTPRRQGQGQGQGQGQVELPDVVKLDLAKVSKEKGPRSSGRSHSGEEIERLAEIAAIREL